MKRFWPAIAVSGAMLIGCTGVNGPSGAGVSGYAQQGPAQQVQLASANQPAAAQQSWTGQAPAVPNYGPAPQQQSWTQQVSSAVKKPLAAFGLAGTGAVKTPIDTISLGYGPNKPTPDLLLSMADMTAQAGDPGQARKMYDKVLSSDPKNARALLGLAHIEEREGRLEQALPIYQHAANIHPSNATVLNDLGLCYARLGQLEPSLMALHAATKIDPNKALYRNNIAKVLVELNQLDSALAELTVVHPPATAHYNLAVLLHQRGRTAEAINVAGAAVQLDPRSQPALDLLASLNPETVGGYGSTAPQQGRQVAMAPSEPSTTASQAPQGSADSVNGPAGYPSTGYSQLPFPAAQNSSQTQTSPGGTPDLATGTAPNHSILVPASNQAATPAPVDPQLLPPIN